MKSSRKLDEIESSACQNAIPDLLTNLDGTPVTSVAQWPLRRMEILDLFSREVYGYTPTGETLVRGERLEEGVAFNGMGFRQQIRLTVQRGSREHTADCLLFRPMDAKQPVPLLLGLNFHGNHTVTFDPEVLAPSSRQLDAGERGLRGAMAGRWPMEKILQQGFAVATMYCGDWAPDDPSYWQEGAWQLVSEDAAESPETWGSIGVWAWGLSRALDYLLTDPAIDGEKVAVIGHSRLGKTALWAGAQDQRFSLIVSNDSGCGGAAISRRRIGETVKTINEQFPHWFCGNFKKYNDREDELPVDQHMLITLAAPRPIYVASAEDDLWADPRGEFLAAKYAEPVFRLFGKRGLQSEDLPPADQPDNSGSIGYHIRSGGHDLTSFDWEQYLGFAKSHWG